MPQLSDSSLPTIRVAVFVQFRERAGAQEVRVRSDLGRDGGRDICSLRPRARIIVAQAKLQTRIHELRQHTANYDDAMTTIDKIGNFCKEFPTQPLAEQRRLLHLLMHAASWKGGKFEAMLKTPFQKLWHANRGSHTNDRENGDEDEKIENWLPVMDTFRTLSLQTQALTPMMPHSP